MLEGKTLLLFSYGLRSGRRSFVAPREIIADRRKANLGTLEERPSGETGANMTWLRWHSGSKHQHITNHFSTEFLGPFFVPSRRSRSHLPALPLKEWLP